MTTEERESRRTAYALNDPGLSAADRAEVEAVLAADPAAMKEVEDTRTLAGWLAAGLTGEQARASGDGFVTVPATAPAKRRAWQGYVVAAGLLVAVGGAGVWAFLNTQGERAGFTFGNVALNTAAKPAVAVKGQSPMADRGATPNDMLSGQFGLQTEQQQGQKIDNSESAAKDQPVGVGVGSGPPPAGYGGGAGYPGRASGGDAAPDAAPRVVGASPKGAMAEADKPSSGSGGRPAGGPAGPQPAKPADPTPTPLPAGDHPVAEAKPVAPGEPLDSLRDAKALSPSRSKQLKERLDAYDKADGTAAVAKSDRENLRQQYEDALRAEATVGGMYRGLVENRFTAVEGQAALSTFGTDVDTASYSIVRKYLTSGHLPPADSVRLEELVNYFPYRDKAPEGNDPFAVTVEMAACPWQPNHRLARIGLKAKPIETDKRPVSNLVFLIDVSGSMNEPNKLPLVKESLRLLVNQLGENDRVAMVVYAGASGLVLDSTSAMHKDRILGALDRLSAGGSTNGGSGIQLAYGVAAAHFIKGGTNRVILCTDGDWNVGTTGTAELVKLIEEKRQTGVFLSVLGFGMGNLRDEMMVQMAGKGNGNYAYIDTIQEARKALVEQLSGTLVTVAKDVKVQVEFNPAVVKAYRLLGYEKRALAAKDFADDKKDAGEMGAGHVVTALYELVPAGAAPPGPKEDELRYQPKAVAAPAKGTKADEAFVVKMRHKQPDGDTSTLRELPVKDSTLRYDQASEDFRFAAAVASFAMLLRESAYKGNGTYAAVIELADAAKSHDPNGYRAEFVELAKRAKALSGKP